MIAQLSIKYICTFYERLKNEFFKSTSNLVILTFMLEIQFEMFKMTPFASEAYLQTLLFARASLMRSSIFNILNTNTVFPLRFLALRSLVTNFQSQKLPTLALVFIIRLISQKIIGIFKSRNTVLEMEHSSSCSPNGIKLHGISAENKPHEFAEMAQTHQPKKASFVSLGRRVVFTQK